MAKRARATYKKILSRNFFAFLLVSGSKSSRPPSLKGMGKTSICTAGGCECSFCIPWPLLAGTSLDTASLSSTFVAFSNCLQFQYVKMLVVFFPERDNPLTQRRGDASMELETQPAKPQLP